MLNELTNKFHILYDKDINKIEVKTFEILLKLAPETIKVISFIVGIFYSISTNKISLTLIALITAIAVSIFNLINLKVFCQTCHLKKNDSSDNFKEEYIKLCKREGRTNEPIYKFLSQNRQTTKRDRKSAKEFLKEIQLNRSIVSSIYQLITIENKEEYIKNIEMFLLKRSVRRSLMQNYIKNQVYIENDIKYLNFIFSAIWIVLIVRYTGIFCMKIDSTQLGMSVVTILIFLISFISFIGMYLLIQRNRYRWTRAKTFVVGGEIFFVSIGLIIILISII